MWRGTTLTLVALRLDLSRKRGRGEQASGSSRHRLAENPGARFDLAAKSYRKIPVEQQCEVLSAIGDIAEGDDGKPSLHLHVVLGLSDGSTRGGHLLDAIVRPTLEVTVVEAPMHLRRKQRPDLGIALISLA